MERRGFPPYIIDVRRMAQTLLARRDASSSPPTIGKHWICHGPNNEVQQCWKRLDQRLTECNTLERQPHNRRQDRQVIMQGYSENLARLAGPWRARHARWESWQG